MEGVSGTPGRQPLQEVGNKISSKSSTPMFLKRAQYSQVTPFYSPKAKTPLRQKVQIPCAMRLLKENDSTDVPLNSLIYKKVISILEEKQKEHELAVEGKNAQIDRLQHQLQMVKLPTAQNMSPLQTSVAETTMTPTKYESVSVNTSSVMPPAMGTCRTPVTSHVDNQVHVDTLVTALRLKPVSIGTSPLLVHTRGTNTILICGTDIGTNTEFVRRTDAETNTNYVSGVDVGTVVTPVKCHDSSQSTSPVRLRSQETCTTPPRQLTCQSSATSPINHTIPRPSEIDFSSLGVKDLALQLESAAVSNTLLRSQVETLRHEKSSAIRKVALTAAEVQQHNVELKRLEVEADRREKLANMSATTQVEELMEQQAQLLTQISALRGEITQRDATLTATKSAHDEHTISLNAELTNLRKDLVTAYQRRKQEVEELRLKYMATDYKPLYQREHQSVVLLEAQLTAFMGLEDEIKDAKKMQEEAAALVSKRAAEVEEKLELATEHFRRDQEWEKQHMEFKADVAAHKEQVWASESEMQKLQENLTEARQKVSKLNEDVEKHCDQEKVHFVEMESLRATIAITKQEAKAANEGLQVKTEEVAALTKEVFGLRTVLGTHVEQMSKLVQERDRYMTLGEQQRNSLVMLRTGARRTDHLEQQLESLQAEHKNFKDDYFKQTCEFGNEIEFLKAEHSIQLSEEEKTKRRIKQLEEDTTQFESRAELAADELEAMRAHHMLLNQHKETENDVALIALNDLAQKVGLLQRRVSFCRLQCVSDAEEGAAAQAQDEAVMPYRKSMDVRRSMSMRKSMDTRKTMDFLSVDKSRRFGRKSFVSSVLCAVTGVASPATPLSTLDDEEEHDVIGDDANDDNLPKLGVQIDSLGKTLDGLLETVSELAEHVKDAMSVKADITRLQQKMDTQTATIERYKNQKVRLHYNWELAESELKKLENIVEIIREVLCAHEDEIRLSWREANRLHRFGMLTTDDPTASTQHEPETHPNTIPQSMLK